MWKTKIRAGLVVAVLALSGTLATAQVAEPIKIGSFLSLSGEAGTQGDAQLKTLQLYVSKINADGGVLDRPLELIHYDDRGDPAEAGALAMRLLGSDEVTILVGGTTASTAAAVASVAANAQTPLIALSRAGSVLGPANPWVFSTAPSSRVAVEPIFKDMRQRGITNIGLISSRAEFGEAGRDQARALAVEQGIQIVSDERYLGSSGDFAGSLTRIHNSAGIQAVLNIDLEQGSASATRGLRMLGVELPLYQTNGAASPSYLELTGDAAEGVRLPVGGLLVANQLPADDPQAGVLLSYLNTYRDAYGVEPSPTAGYARDGLMLAVEAIARAGSIDSAELREAIEQTRGLVGVTGVFNLSADDHNGLDASDLHMAVIKNGAWSLIE